MGICPSCGRENPLDRDFCACGEYLRWEPTSTVRAITPGMLRGPTPDASQKAPPPRASTAPVPAVPPAPAAPAPIARIAKTLTHGAVPPPRPLGAPEVS